MLLKEEKVTVWLGGLQASLSESDWQILTGQEGYRMGQECFPWRREGTGNTRALSTQDLPGVMLGTFLYSATLQKALLSLFCR